MKASPQNSVVFYRAEPDSPLRAQALSILNAGEEFVQRVAAYASSKNAQDFELIDYSASHELFCFRYLDEKDVPFDWREGDTHGVPMGGYMPTSYALDYAEVRKLSIPVQKLTVRPGFDIAFHKLGNDVILAATPNKDGTAPQIPGAERLEPAVLDQLKEEAPEKDLSGFDQMTNPEWNFLTSALARLPQLPEETKRQLNAVEQERRLSNNNLRVPHRKNSPWPHGAAIIK